MNPEPDYAVEEFQWPEPSEMEVADALELLDGITRQLTIANKRAKRLTSRKATATKIALAVLEMKRQPSASIEAPNGRRIQYTPYQVDWFDVDDMDAFLDWAMKQDEVFTDSAPRVVKERMQDYARQLYSDGQPIPPGVRRYTDDRISRTAIK